MNKRKADATVIFDLLESSSSSSSSSESDDNEVIYSLLNQLRREKHFKNINFVNDVVNNYSDIEFKRHFRMERDTYNKLNSIFRSSIFCKNQQGGGRPKVHKNEYVLIFLWFAANKCSIRQISNLFGYATSKIHGILICVMDFLNHIAEKTIRFPSTTREKEISANEFFRIAGLPNTIGCIDGTYIPITTPVNKIRSTYVNRHDQTSITLQAICDANRRFLDVCCGAPSKIHDSRVYKLSPISHNIETICENRFHIIGDAAYEIRPWLLTPFRMYERLSDTNKKYNDIFAATRVRIENAFGILKRRFIQLLRVDIRKVDQINKFVIACCVLHNFCIDAHDLWDEESVSGLNVIAEPLTYSDTSPSDIALSNAGKQKRDCIANQL